jgi:hypothetical protein
MKIEKSTVGLLIIDIFVFVFFAVFPPKTYATISGVGLAFLLFWENGYPNKSMLRKIKLIKKEKKIDK